MARDQALKALPEAPAVTATQTIGIDASSDSCPRPE